MSPMISAVIFVYKNDEQMIEPFIRRFRSLYGTAARLWLAVDRTAPIRDDIAPTVPRLVSHWSDGGQARVQSVLAALTDASSADGSAYALKLDVDVLHLSSSWLLDALKGGADAVAHPHPGGANPDGHDWPWAFTGAAYAIRADIIPELQEVDTADYGRDCPEDLTIAHMLKTCGHRTHLHHTRNPAGQPTYDIHGWQTEWTGKNYRGLMTLTPSLIHLGQSRGRRYAVDVLTDHPGE